MDRIIEEREVDGHHVAIVEQLMDEGAGYVLVIDGVLAAENEPLGHAPSDAEIRDIVRAHGLR